MEDTHNKATAVSLFLEDAPVEELSTSIKMLMKVMVINALFK